VHEDELQRLRQALGRERRASVTKRSLLSLPSGLLGSREGGGETNPEAGLATERGMLYAGIGTHVAPDQELFSRACTQLGVDPTGKNRKKQLSDNVWAYKPGAGAKRGRVAEERQVACDASAEIYLHVLRCEAELREEKLSSPPGSPAGEDSLELAPLGERETADSDSFAIEKHGQRVRRDLVYAVRASLSSLARDHERKAMLQGELYEAQCTILALQRQMEAMEQVLHSRQGMRFAGTDSSGEDMDGTTEDAYSGSDDEVGQPIAKPKGRAKGGPGGGRSASAFSM
jgi:hypothetical protein